VCFNYASYIFIYQVDFEKIVYVVGVATQGRHDWYYYMKTFRLLYSLDCVEFQAMKQPDGNDTVCFISHLGLHVDYRCDTCYFHIILIFENRVPLVR